MRETRDSNSLHNTPYIPDVSSIWGVHSSVSVVLEELCVGSPDMCREFQGSKVLESVGSPDTLLT